MSEDKSKKGAEPREFDENAAKCEAYAIVPVGVSMLKTENEDLGKQIITACVHLARWQFDKDIAAFDQAIAERDQLRETLARRDSLMKYSADELINSIDELTKYREIAEKLAKHISDILIVLETGANPFSNRELYGHLYPVLAEYNKMKEFSK